MPSVPNARQGWQNLAAAWVTSSTEASERSIWVRVGMLVLLLQTLVGGLWITLSPATFFSEFPGFGRAWVSIDGPYNEHLLRDFGALNLALSVVLLFAVVRPERRLASTANLAVLAGALPHFSVPRTSSGPRGNRP
jgi:hypothetical protein